MRLKACAVIYIVNLFWINNPLQNYVCANLTSSGDSVFQDVIVEPNTNKTSLLNKKNTFSNISTWFSSMSAQIHLYFRQN